MAHMAFLGWCDPSSVLRAARDNGSVTIEPFSPLGAVDGAGPLLPPGALMLGALAVYAALLCLAGLKRTTVYGAALVASLGLFLSYTMALAAPSDRVCLCFQKPAAAPSHACASCCGADAAVRL